jgi:hypothetical protein
MIQRLVNINAPERARARARERERERVRERERARERQRETARERECTRERARERAREREIRPHSHARAHNRSRSYSPSLLKYRSVSFDIVMFRLTHDNTPHTRNQHTHLTFGLLPEIPSDFPKIQQPVCMHVRVFI